MGNYGAVLLSDFTAYAVVGQRYADGEWSKAINGYWAPGICWILSIIIKLGATKASIGIIWLYFQALVLGLIWARITEKFVGNAFHWIVVLLISLPAIVYFSLLYPSADILVGSIYLVFINQLNKAFIFKDFSLKQSFILALITSLAYYFKYFSLPFCLALSGSVSGIYVIRNLRCFGKISMFYVSYLMFIALFVGPWIALLSVKYEQFTISNSQQYTQAYNHPQYVGKVLEEVSGLIKPPYTDSPTAWEDPSYHPYPKWSAFENKAMFTHALHRFYLYFSLAMRYGIGYCSFLAWLIIAYALWKIYTRSDHYLLQFIMLTAMLLYAFGYSVYFFDERHYIWFYFALVWLMVISYRPHNAVVTAWVILNALVFMRMPCINYKIYNTMNKSNVEILEAINTIPDAIIRDKRIAGNNDDLTMNLAWRRNAYSYGVPPPENGLTHCLQNKIDVFIKFKDHKTPPLPLVDKIWESNNRQIEIFRLN